jgi:hypothetical protein
MNYAVQMGLGAMIYIPSLIKICLGVQKLFVRIRTQTHRRTDTQQRNLTSLILFFKNKEHRLKTGCT